jgi:hypothetical protein
LRAAAGDVFPHALAKLAKGEYTLRLQVRHDSVEMLERVEAMLLQLDWKLKEPVSVDCYADLGAARTESGTAPFAAVAFRHVAERMGEHAGNRQVYQARAAARGALSVLPQCAPARAATQGTPARAGPGARLAVAERGRAVQDARPGDVLVGAIKLGRGPNEYPLRYVVPPDPADKGKKATSAYVGLQSNTHPHMRPRPQTRM